MKRVLIVLLVTVLAFFTMAASCTPDPTPSGWSAEDAIHATETYGAEQWHLQLTALAETPEP